MAKEFKLSNILGGKFLAHNGGLAKQWVFVVYIFILVILTISFGYIVKETLLTEVKNQEIIKDLKSEYTGKYAKLLYLSKRAEIEKRLKENGSTIEAPTLPPVIIEKENGR